MIPDTIKINADYYLSTHFIASDVDSYVNYLNDKEIYKNTLRIPFPYTKSDAEWFINHVKEREKDFGQPMHWQLRNKTHELIGGIGLFGQYGKNSHKDEIEYWIAKPFWNNGLMTKTLNILSKFIFEHYNIVRIEATIFYYNIASQRVLEKCGFNYEGTLKKAYFKDKKYIDAKLFALIKK